MPPTPKAKKLTRNNPRQKRSAKTYDLILDTAAKLLEEVGFDKLTTNLICQRAEITPPALYHYFPNKYAVLQVLGERLMKAQEDALKQWYEELGSNPVTAENAADMLMQQHLSDRQQVGAKWIWRSLRSIPAIEHVLNDSKQSARQMSIDHQLAMAPAADLEKVSIRYGILVDASTAILQELIDKPTPNAERICAEAGVMIAGFVAGLGDPD